jgi:flagellar biosynthesis/type III secretory pathway ATPase
MGESVSDLYALAGSNTAKAWSHTLDSSEKLFALAGSNTAKAWSQTLDSSEKLLGRVLDSAGRTTDAAKVVAQSAIASYQPAEKSQADALRMGLLIGGGVLLAVLIFRKA